MPHPTFGAILDENIELFASAFSRTARNAFYDDEKKTLIHSGEFGAYREAIVRDFLRLVVPGRLAIQSGFLMTPKGGMSTQCDIVIFDSNNTPLIESVERQRFYPVESVCGIGEIKSELSRQGLREALNKLAKNKSLREQIVTPVAIRRESAVAASQYFQAYDQIVSFLICQKFAFQSTTLAQELPQLYDSDVPIRHRHNLVLSIEDGVALYYDACSKTMMYPELRDTPLHCRFVAPAENRLVHLHLFCAYMFLLTSNATVFYPDVADYMPSLQGGFNYDET
jgi:hypothetical protein